MLMKRMTPSRAGVDEVVHDSGSVLLLDSRQRRQRLLGWLPQSAPRRGRVWWHIKPFVPI